MRFQMDTWYCKECGILGDPGDKVKSGDVCPNCHSSDTITVLVTETVAAD